jgi:fumarate reductase flavoprotein subunit
MAAINATQPLSAAQSTTSNNAVTKSWRDKPDPIDEKLISDGGTYDIVVVGGGNAGLVCARAASANGATVAVIENQAEKGYVRGIGSQCGTVNSQYALDHGAPRIDEDDFLREWARRNIIRHNPKRVSYFVKNSGRIFDWLISIADKKWLDKACHEMSCPPPSTVLTEVSGWKFYFGCASFRGYEVFSNSNTTGNQASPPASSSNFGQRLEPWSEFLRMHQEKAMVEGAKWFNEHHAEICDVDASGAVTGVVAKRKEGALIRFKARKGVALCAGDFGGNREMVLDILDQVRHEALALGNLGLVRASGGMGSPRDGMGIKMGVWAGGHVEIGPHSCIGEGDPGTGVWFLQLDHNGERFHDEAAGTTLAQPKGTVRVTLYDSNWKKILYMQPPRHMAADLTMESDLAPRLSHLDNLKPGPIAKTQQTSGRGMGMGMGSVSGIPGVSGVTCCANTLEDLVDYMGCYQGEAKKKALAEIKRYNELCAKGVDLDFGKDRSILKATALKNPLFYATVGTYNGTGMFGLGAGMSATSGLDTDAEGRVLNSEFKPIKGLFAAGNNAGGRFITVYQSPISGISIGMAVTEGFLLGELLAKL